MEMLKFPPYNVVIPGSVYSLKTAVKENAGSRQILVLSRFVRPTSQNIVAYITDQIEKIEYNGGYLPKVANSFSERQEERIRKSLEMLPKELREQIRKDNSELIKNLKEDSEESVVLSVHYGSLSLQEIAENEGKINDFGKRAYHFLIDKNSLDELIISLDLDDRKLPKRSKIETLLECGVRRSDVLAVNLCTDSSEYAKAKELVMAIYENLTSAKKINMIDDDSGIYLKSSVLETLTNMNNQVQNQEMISSFQNMVESMIKNGLKIIPIEGSSFPKN